MPTKEFSCWRVKFSKPIKNERDFVANWLSLRPNESWVLLSGDVLAGKFHVAVAFEVLNRNRDRNMMKSTGIDGEFMRLVAGTHHVSHAFSKVGLTTGDSQAWLVDLTQESSAEAQNICNMMKFQLLPSKPSSILFEPSRLGLPETADENDAIGLIHLADIR